MSGNQALIIDSVVGPQANLAITTHGSDWYWAVTGIMGAASFVFMGMSLTKTQDQRLFHYITSAITLVAGIAYYSMASGLGQVPIQAEFVRPLSTEVFAAGTREIFYVRYIDWFVTTPLLLLDLLLTAGMPAPTIAITILADWIMVVCGLVGALTQTSYKWGYWVFGMFAFFFVVHSLVIDGRRRAAALGSEVKRVYNMCGVLTIVVWFLYPIAWGLSEGGNVIHPDSEAIFYGILDVCAKPLFGALLIWGHRNIDPADLGIGSRRTGASNGLSEKNGHHHVGNSNGVGNGVDNGVGNNVGVADGSHA